MGIYGELRKIAEDYQSPIAEAANKAIDAVERFREADMTQPGAFEKCADACLALAAYGEFFRVQTQPMGEPDAMGEGPALGDADEKSAAIMRAIEVTAGATVEACTYDDRFLRALENIQKNPDGVRFTTFHDAERCPVCGELDGHAALCSVDFG